MSRKQRDKKGIRAVQESGPDATRSVVDSQGELNIPWTEEGTTDLAKASVLHSRIGFVEGVSVECVKQFAAEFGMNSFSDGNGLANAQVFVVKGEAANVSGIAGHISELIRNIDLRVGVGIGEGQAVPVPVLAGIGRVVVAGVAVVVESEGVEGTRAARRLASHAIGANAVVEPGDSIGTEETDWLTAEVALNA